MSIQVCLSGYSFKVSDGETTVRSNWLSADKLFTTPQFQRSYDKVELSLLTPKAALVPSSFFDSSSLREELSRSVSLEDTDTVGCISLPEYQAELLYSLSIGEILSDAIAKTLFSKASEPIPVLPEMYFILKDLQILEDYNRIIASFADGHLHLAIAQGKNLLLSNVYDAVDFTTAEYFIFLALKKLQLNPEVSSIFFRTPLAKEEELSLYRYFKSVETL